MNMGSSEYYQRWTILGRPIDYFVFDASWLKKEGVGIGRGNVNIYMANKGPTILPTRERKL